MPLTLTSAELTESRLCEAIQTHNHPVLWLTFKRAVLNLCGLYVVVVLLLVASALAVHTTARL